MVRVANEFLEARCRVQQENPKSGASEARYEKYKAARTLGEIIKLGGSRGDIGNDMLRGYIVVEDTSIHDEILLTANESERRHLPDHLLRKLPASSGGADPRAAPKPRPQKVPAKYAPEPERRPPPPPKAPPKKLAPAPADLWANEEKKRRREDVKPANDKASLRKRAVACNKKRAKIFGRTVGKGRLLPVYDDSSL